MAQSYRHKIPENFRVLEPKILFVLGATLSVKTEIWLIFLPLSFNQRNWLKTNLFLLYFDIIGICIFSVFSINTVASTTNTVCVAFTASTEWVASTTSIVCVASTASIVCVASSASIVCVASTASIVYVAFTYKNVRIPTTVRQQMSVL